MSENADIGVATVALEQGSFAGDVARRAARSSGPRPTASSATPRTTPPRSSATRSRRTSGASAARRQGPRRRGRRPARRPPVGHADDPRHADGLLHAPAGLARGPRRHHRHRHRRQPPRHRAQLQRAAEPELHRRRPVDRRRRATRSRTSRARTRRTSTRTGTARTWRRPSASPLNGIGIAGVAPKVDLVNLRAGQDSGYFFLGPTLDALTYAGDHGIDVVNMSYYIDPWLYNCAANPADSPAEQREQRLVIAATQRAIDYARDHGVTTIAAEGNGHTDLGKPTFDDTSPDYPRRRRPSAHRARSTTRASRCRQRPTASSASPRSGRRAQGVLLRLRRRAGRRRRPRRRRARHARRLAQRSQNTILAAYPKRRSASRPATIDPATRRADHPAVIKQGGGVLPVHPGHLDGLAARGRRRGADRRRVRQARQAQRRR